MRQSAEEQECNEWNSDGQDCCAGEEVYGRSPKQVCGASGEEIAGKTSDEDSGRPGVYAFQILVPAVLWGEELKFSICFAINEMSCLVLPMVQL